MERFVQSVYHHIATATIHAFGEKMNRYTETAYDFVVEEPLAILVREAYDKSNAPEPGSYLFAPNRTVKTDEGGLNIWFCNDIDSPTGRHFMYDVVSGDVFDADAFIAYQMGFARTAIECMQMFKRTNASQS